MNLPDITGAPVAVDTETTGLYPDDGARITTVSVATEGFSAAFPFALQGAPNLSKQDYADLVTWLKKQRLIYQHMKFDNGMFLNGPPEGFPPVDLESNFYWDTKEATGLLWPVGPWKLNEKNHKKEYTTSLKPVSEWLWGPAATEAEKRLKEFLNTLPKGQRKRYDLVPWDILSSYTIQDVNLTYRLWLKQRHHNNDKPEYNPLLLREFELEKVLYRMENRGIGFDVEQGREVAGALRHSLEELATQLPVRPTRQQMVKYWWEEDDAAPGWLPRTEKTSQVQMDEYAMWKLAKLGYPFAQTFADYQSVKQALSKWYEPWPEATGKDGRLRVDYRQNGAMTGRLSGARVPLQGIPQDHTLSKLVPSVRKLFVPKDGCELWEIDLSQAELRIATSIAKVKLARHYIETGMDMHAETAKKIFNTDGDWKVEPYKKYRYIAKTTNFAVLYTAGAKTLVEQITREGKIDFTMAEAYKIMAEHKKLYPEYYRETDIAASKMRERGWVQLVSGRRIYFQPWEHRFYKAFNNVIQGNVAEAMKDIMIWIERHYPGILLLQIHDSVVLEVPKAEAHEVVTAIADYMENLTSDLFHIRMKADFNKFGRNAYA